MISMIKVYNSKNEQINLMDYQNVSVFRIEQGMDYNDIYLGVSNDITRLGIGFLNEDDHNFLLVSFYASWICLQFRVDYANKFQTRFCFGESGWTNWKTL